MLKIPNVKIINPKIAGAELAKNSQIVFTISGTAAWEAILLGRPIITFGDVFYNELSFVERCHSYEDLAELVQKQLSPRYDERELLHFLNALLEDSVYAPIADLWTKNFRMDEIIENEGLKNFARLVVSKLNA
jgi:capsule polysaccharide export protein KpsC/LpsZ